MKADPEGWFDALYRDHHRELLAFVRRRSSTGEAEDVVAETFVVAWRRIDVVPDPARGWLFAVARNILRNQERSQHRQRSLQLQLAEQGQTYAPDPAASIAGRTDLAHAWNRLTDNEREVIALTAWDELTQEEAATVLGCTKAAYAVRLYRARRRLLHLIDRTTSGGRRG
ncbi:MAG TPA: RNA polymerase sigma factor [Candidatus Ruania gallistercoris]|uniref:RNA polymerase sigma factor n=1 Tax=Candidatus Ruania gallistercoris TaxID=2838746 RepID=A0A9D2EE62_9MICO|nr:RNA polymerase sigma factor [Candidatus Ruania gallistercoris]